MGAYPEEAWNAVGDRTRRMIMLRLAERPQAVGELAAQLPVSRPAVSQHLRILKDAGAAIRPPHEPAPGAGAPRGRGRGPRGQRWG